MPLQVLPDGAGSIVLFTALRRPGLTDDEYAADVAAVEHDLATLRTILDTRADRPVADRREG